MSSDLIKELRQLSELVNKSAQHAQRQFQSVEPNLLIGSLISLILALGLSVLFEILIYWVSASFLLMYLWAIYSFFRTKKPKIRDLEETTESLQKLGQAKIELGFEWFFMNVSSVIKAVSLIYAITLVVLILIFVGKIQLEQSISVVIPVITALLYLSAPLFIDRTSDFFTKGYFTQILQKAVSVQKPKAVQLGFLLGGLIYVFLMIGFPIWSLIETRSFYLPFGEKALLLLPVLFLQIITIAILSSYFSSLTVKRELANTLTNLADIDYQINNLLLNKEVDNDTFNRLRGLYLTAKKYDVVVDNYFIFVNCYFLVMNRTYLQNK